MWLVNQLAALDQHFMSFKGHHVAFAVALAILIVSTVALGAVHPKADIRRRLGPDFFSTDTAFGYRADDLYAMLGKYESDDYKAHKLFIALDLIYPLLYSISAAVMIGYLIPFVAGAEGAPRIHCLTLVPLAAAVCDLLENLSMLLILNLREGNVAGRSNALACFSSAMTMAKLILIYATLLLTLVGIALIIIAAARRKQAYPV